MRVYHAGCKICFMICRKNLNSKIYVGISNIYMHKSHIFRYSYLQISCIKIKKYIYILLGVRDINDRFYVFLRIKKVLFDIVLIGNACTMYDRMLCSLNTLVANF